MSKPPNGYRQLPPGALEKFEPPKDTDNAEIRGAILLALLCIAIAIAVVVLAPR